MMIEILLQFDTAKMFVHFWWKTENTYLIWKIVKYRTKASYFRIMAKNLICLSNYNFFIYFKCKNWLRQVICILLDFNRIFLVEIKMATHVFKGFKVLNLIINDLAMEANIWRRPDNYLPSRHLHNLHNLQHQYALI